MVFFLERIRFVVYSSSDCDMEKGKRKHFLADKMCSIFFFPNEAISFSPVDYPTSYLQE